MDKSNFSLTSSAFLGGETIPSKYTCDGQDISPPLAWNDPPAGTVSFALISDDPDAPSGNWVHWVLWNIPADVRSMPENTAKMSVLTDSTRQGITDFGRAGYGGPCPPSGTHRYFFRLYALNTALELPQRTGKNQLLHAMKNNILATAELMGKYSRQR